MQEGMATRTRREPLSFRGGVIKPKGRQAQRRVNSLDLRRRNCEKTNVSLCGYLRDNNFSRNRIPPPLT